MEEINNIDIVNEAPDFSMFGLFMQADIVVKLVIIILILRDHVLVASTTNLKSKDTVKFLTYALSHLADYNPMSVPILVCGIKKEAIMIFP